MYLINNIINKYIRHINIVVDNITLYKERKRRLTYNKKKLYSILLTISSKYERSLSHSSPLSLDLAASGRKGILTNIGR